MSGLKVEKGKVHFAGQVLYPDEALDLACALADAVKRARVQSVQMAVEKAEKIRSDLVKARERVRALEAEQRTQAGAQRD